MNNLSSNDSLIIIGKFTKPFGVKGLMRFLPYSGEVAHLSTITHIHVYGHTSNSPKTAPVYEVEHWISSVPFRCKLLGIDSPELAQTQLSGKEIYVPREFATHLEQDEYYIKDLYQIEVVYGEQVQGKIIEVYPDAYAPLLTIEWNNKKKSVIPFIKEYFGVPNLECQRIELLVNALINI